MNRIKRGNFLGFRGYANRLLWVGLAALIPLWAHAQPAVQPESSRPMLEPIRPADALPAAEALKQEAIKPEGSKGVGEAASTPPSVQAPLAQALAARKVFILQTLNHSALDQTVSGIRDGLQKAGYQEGENLDLRVESAQGKFDLAAQIAAKWVPQKPDVVIGVGTLASQAFLKYAREGKVQLVFSSVTDPQGAGLLADPEAQTGQKAVCGVSNFVDPTPQLQLFKQLQPGLKRLGVLYNPGEPNSSKLMEQLKPLCDEYGMELFAQAAYKTADLAQSATQLSKRVEALFINNDNTALGGLPTILGVAKRAKIPVYVSDVDAVALGALAALGPNQYQLGQETAQLALRLWQDSGSLSGNSRVLYPKAVEVYLNAKAAQELGIELEAGLKNQAARVIE